MELLSKEEMTAINNAQPSEAKYGDVFKAIAQAQRDKDYKAIMESRPTEEEIKIRLLDPLLGGGSVPELLDWLKEKLLIK